MRKFFGLFVTVLLLVQQGVAQDFSNKGKEFWVGYGSHVSMYNTNGTVNNTSGGSQQMILYFTSDRNANVTVSIPGLGWSRSYTVIANQVTPSDLIPKVGATDARIFAEGKTNRGIRITSDVPIIAYAHIYNGSVSGATLLFPTTTLSREYYSINFTQSSNDANSFSYAYVIATEDNTNIEIIPSVNTFNNKTGDTIRVLLNRGEVYNVFGRVINAALGEDLTGTRIRSVATPGNPCKKIAVFSGSGKMNIQCNGASNGSADNNIQQAFPANAWGKRYLTAPTSRMPFNYYRICVSDPTAIVRRNGVQLTGLIRNFYYEYLGNTADLIESDKPIMVAQYITTREFCGNTRFTNSSNQSLGDPEMIYLSPLEQTIDKVTINSTPNAFINEHWLNVVVKRTAAASVRVDGLVPAATPLTHPRDAAYSYFQIPLSQGAHTITSDSGFNAIAYGYGNAESYGYNAGANVKDLYQYVSTANQFATVNSPVACKGSPFEFAITLPYVPLSMTWKIPNFPDFVNPGPVVPDSSFVLNGRNLYIYKLPAPYVYNTVGLFNVKVNVNNPTADGCSGEQTIDFDLQVFDQPTSNFTYKSSGCTDSAVIFTSTTNTGGRPISKHYWDFGDGTFDNTANPSKIYFNPGTFTVKYVALTDIGCISDTVTKTISITRIPEAKFGILDSLCIGKVLTFRDSSTLAGGFGNITNWNWSRGVGGPINNTSSADVTATYGATGNYTASLQLQSNTGCYSPVYQKNFIIRPKPTVDFTISHGCLPDPIINFNSTSTIADGTQAGFAYAWNFGDPASGALNSATVQSPSHLYPSAGPFNVQLKITSQYGCIDSVTKVADKIYPQAKAGFTAPAEVCWQTPITFTDASNGFTHPVVRWEWRFSDGTTSTQKNPVKNFANPGTYTATLWVFTDQNCVSDTIVKTVIVNPWPTASFTMSALQCEKNAITFTSTSVPNAGNLIRSYWDFGDGNTSNVTTLNTTHTYTNWGNYTVRFVTETDKGCRNDTLLRPVLVNPLPKVGYILPEVCLNDGVATFIDTSSMADGSSSQLKYLWQFNTGASPVVPAPSPLISTQKSPTINFFVAQNYQLNLKVESKDGCIDSATNVPYTINGVIAKADYSIIQNGLCSNEEIKIQNKSTVVFGWLTKVEIYWDWANNPTQVEVDDEPAVDEIYAHKYPNFQSPLTKTYKVRIRVFSGIICERDYIQDVVVNASPLTTFTAMPGICVDAAPRQITEATENGGLAKLTETYSGPGVSATGLFDPAAAGVGIHTIRYTFTALNGCTHFSESQIEVWPRPTAQLNVLSPNCEKNAITFNSNGSQSNAVSLTTWKWNFGDNTPVVTTTSNTPVTHVYAAYGNYTADLIVTNNRGCNSLPQPLSLTVHPLPIIDFSLPKICLPDGRGQFNDLSTIPDNTQSTFKYRWDFGDNSVAPVNSDTSVLKNPFYQYRNLGPYTVQLKVLTENGCIDSVSKQLIDVFPQPKAGFSTSADSICIGESIDFRDESDGIVRNITRWKWSFGNGDSSFVANPRYRYPSSSNVPYAVQLFVYSAEGCVSDTATKMINVWSYPVVTAGPDITMLQDGLRKITDARASGNLVQFDWSPPTYLDSISVRNPSIVRPQDDITYTFTVTGRGGCETSDDVFVKILKAPKPPNTFTPNGDGINDFWEIKFMNDYPGAVIEVYNTAGSLIYRSVGYSTPWDGKWKGQPLPSGTYYYAIDPKNGRKRISGYVTILR